MNRLGFLGMESRFLFHFIHTKIRPVVVCPDISSPAQSLASVIKVPSNSCFPCRLAFCSFCFGSLGDSSGSLRQKRKANVRHSRTINSPARNVNILDSRKHHHFRPVKQSSVKGGVLTESIVGVIESVDIVSDIPCRKPK